jgi:hypothetical protein
MDLRHLRPELSVAPQISATDIALLKRAGYRSIICNRPDGEASDQPLFQQIEQIAREAGLEPVYLPAESGKVSDQQGQEFGALLASLPKRNEWVFSSPTSASGRLTEPSIAHRTACAAAGLQVTLHGLRRSFASLCEWLDIPGGISAQIQGHAPQGVREQNYIRRPLDLLRVHHEKIEAWILEQAGIVFDAKASPSVLRVVAR